MNNDLAHQDLDTMHDSFCGSTSARLEIKCESDAHNKPFQCSLSATN